MTFAQEVNGALTIPAYWQSAWSACYNVMTLIGSLVAGQVQDWMGRRVCFLLAIISSSAGVAVIYTAQDSAHFLGGKILTGFALGLALTTAQTYVSEIAPMPMRGIALSVNTIMMNIGFLIAISATYSRVSIMDQSAFKVLFAAAWAFPAAMAIGLPFIPESPYWLVQKGKEDKARRALEKLSNASDNVSSRLAEIVATAEHERHMRSQASEASWLDCFRGVNWRRTRIILILQYMPQVIGANLSANAPYFLNQTGLDSQTVIMLIEIGISLGVLSSFVNIYLMMKLPQRSLMIGGIVLCTVVFLIMGIAGCFPRTPTTLLIIGVALQFTPLAYGPSAGGAMAVAGEISSSILRSKSMSIGISFQYFWSVVWLVALPYLFNSDQADLGGNIGWIFFGMGVIMIIVIYFDVPSTKGRSFAELDMMFEEKVPARKFATWQPTGQNDSSP
ncbi:unnamed protein product [Discula destructiva]